MSSQTNFRTQGKGRKDTGWRRENGGFSDEEKSSPTRQQTYETLQNKAGSAHDKGQQFVFKMAAVIGLRGMQCGDDFQLSTNKAGYGNFDDLVYTTGKTRYFLQLKHTEKPGITKLVRSELVPLLHKCFESYCSIIQGPTFKELKSSEFVIYTNKQLGPKLLEHNRQQREIDVIFKTCDTGEIFNFTPDENKEIDVYTGVEKLVKESKEFSDLSPPERKVKLKMIREFLKKLIMVTGQKGQRELDDMITEEIRQHDAVKFSPEMYNKESLYFKMLLETWLRNKQEKATADTTRNCLQIAKTRTCFSVVGELSDRSRIKHYGTGIVFSDNEISRLKAELSYKRAVHLRSDALTLCRILLLDCLPISKHIFVNFESLQSHTEELLHSWLGGFWKGLIVFCDSTFQSTDISKTCLDICRRIESVPLNKYLIILTSCSVPEITDFFPIEHEFRFEQLSKKSQAIVLDTKIEFQSCKVTMRKVLQRHGKVEHVLGPELVTDMITEGTAVNIGGRMQMNNGYYAVRVLERNIYLRLDILKEVHLLDHLFVVSGMRENDVSEFVPSGQTVQTLSYTFKNGVHYGTSNETDSPEEVGFIRIEGNDLETCYTVLCQLHSEKTLHWVELKNRNFLWIRSSGATDNLLNYVDYGRTRLDPRVVTEYMKNPEGGINEEAIWKQNGRTVLVVDEPGMGKSCTTTQVAWHTKLADRTSWVVRINWNDHTSKLQEINTETFSFDSLVEFLCSAAFNESKYTDIISSLLKHALQNSGNVTVLMDGFDEISPIHADKAAAILFELMKTKVEKVWVTSRPVQKERLEKELSVTACGMRKLSLLSQEDMLIVLWQSKADGEELRNCRLLAFIHDLLKELNDLFYEDNFTGCPLYVTMIATVYEKYVDESLNSEEWIPPMIDLVYLYEKFVERKLHIYLTEKQKADITNSCVQDDHEDLKVIYLKNFEKCALVAILPPSILKSLHNKQIEKEIESFLGRVQAGKDKRGVVMAVIEGKPYFVHRTFAEYFTARWFSRNFESNRSVLERILFDPEYGFVRYMFDRILAKESAMPCAVLQEDMKCAKTLLEEGSDVKVVDKGGRTVMHLLAARSRKDGHYNTHIVEFINGVTHHEDSLHKADSVLLWTPLQYAIKAENWFVVERLLERNVERSGLDMIRQRAHDQHFINRMIIHAATYGHVLLLEYLCSIGVNIHQASSREFPSPLHAAIREEELSVIRLLIQHGANCNTRYSDGQTPLFYAVTKGSLDVVQLLVEEGDASLDICDDYGRTVFNWISNCKSHLEDSDGFPNEYKLERLNEIVKYLQERGSK